MPGNSTTESETITRMIAPVNDRLYTTDEHTAWSPRVPVLPVRGVRPPVRWPHALIDSLEHVLDIRHQPTRAIRRARQETFYLPSRRIGVDTGR